MPHEESGARGGRLRVFVSSTVDELAAEREAARAAILDLRLSPVLLEIGAQPHPPASLYRPYVEHSDVFVGIYGTEYGWVPPDADISGVEDEYRVASGRPRLLYVKAAERRDPRLEAFLERIRADDEASYRPFRTAVELGELIGDDLAVLLTERFEGTPNRSGRPGAVPPRAAVPVPVTDIVGRDAEIAEAVALLQRPDVRLVSLTGPGGIGKTRLAIAVVEAVAATFERVVFVPLANVVTGGDAIDAVASAVGSRVVGAQAPLEAVAEAIGSARVLLVLDNVEHVVACARDLLGLMERCRNLHVLVTSRVLLRVRGEHELPVGPLPVPAAAPECDVDDVAASPAVALFVTRAREVRASFALDAANAAAVAEICRRLDGLPLALELAAARTRLLSPAALLERLSTRLDLLSGGPADLPERQRTLRATIEWSFGLLTPEQCARCHDLGVFAGGFDLDAAGAVWQTDEMATLDVLGVLLDSSLISAVPGEADVRFRMLQTIRGYAAERLDERPDAAAVRERHARWYAGLCRGANRRLQGAENAAWTRRLETELDNLRAAVGWLLAAGEAAVVGEVCWELFVFWWQGAHLREASSWAREALNHVQRMDPNTAARVYWTVGALALQMGDDAVADPNLEEAEARFTALGDEEGLGASRLLLAPSLARQGRLEEAAAAAARAEALLREHGNTLGYAVALSIQGTLAMIAGDADEAERLHRASLAVGEELGSEQLVAQALNQLGFVALARGDVAGARELVARGEQGYLRAGNAEGIALTLEAYAAIALAGGEHRRAGLALAHAAQLRDRISISQWPALQPVFDAARTAIRAALGEAASEAVEREGRALSRREVLAAAAGAPAGVR